jgi:hypothetical protein
LVNLPFNVPDINLRQLFAAFLDTLFLGISYQPCLSVVNLTPLDASCGPEFRRLEAACL